MTSYSYDISIILSGEIIADQLQVEIDNNVGIVPNCSYIDTNSTDINCWFDSALDIGEQTILENLIINFVKSPIPVDIFADNFGLSNPINNITKYTKNGLLITKNTETLIGGGWTHIIGNLTGFDNTTGEFTCNTNGVYFYNILVKTANAKNNTDIHILCKDASDIVQFGTTNRLSNIVLPTYTFMGNGQMLFVGNKLKFSLEIDTNNISVDLEFKIMRLLC